MCKINKFEDFISIWGIMYCNHNIFGPVFRILWICHWTLLIYHYFPETKEKMFYNFKFIKPKKLITNLLMKPEDCSSTLLTRESGTAMALSWEK